MLWFSPKLLGGVAIWVKPQWPHWAVETMGHRGGSTTEGPTMPDPYSPPQRRLAGDVFWAIPVRRLHIHIPVPENAHLKVVPRCRVCRVFDYWIVKFSAKLRVACTQDRNRSTAWAVYCPRGDPKKSNACWACCISA
jgi:hypothetical protein